MEKDRSTLTNQKAIKSACKSVLKSKGYEFFSENDFSNLQEIPDKYVIVNSRYRGIYESRSISPFKVFNSEKSINERIEITVQKSQGSVDSKFPYYYLNAATAHNDDVIMLVDGDGYKPQARKWLEKQISEKWLFVNEKNISLVSLSEFLIYIEKEY